MSVQWKKWAPAIAVPVVIVAAALVVPAAASAAPNLPAKTPTEVLQLIAHSDVSAFSGDVTLTSDLGLPSLSSIPGGGQAASSSNYLDLLSGSHSVRVYRDGDKARLQDMEQLAERDVVVNGSSVWVYDSAQKTAVHATLPSGTKTPTPATTTSPDAVASQLVTALEPSSTLTVTTAQRVAGRDAYTLVLTPKATDTLVGSIQIAVDASTGLPLEVAATARGESSPAWSLGFDTLTLSAPSASLFDFTPPSSAKVTEQTAPTSHAARPSASDLPKPTVTGSGWDAVVSLQAGDVSSLTSSKQFAQLTTAVTGGRLLHTSLVNILITDSGEVLAGSVPAATLEAAAAQK